jgi:transcriptional regulator with XRE-family HTH domain
MTSGTDLKIRRIKRHVTTIELADKAGWARRRVSQIEGQAVVSDGIAARYIAALAVCR